MRTTRERLEIRVPVKPGPPALDTDAAAVLLRILRKAEGRAGGAGQRRGTGEPPGRRLAER